jgi:hypothetical protein
MRGWINVTWDTGSNNNYRYGPNQADHDEVPEGFGPFIMDVIPEEMDLSQEVAKELSWTMAGETPPQPVAPNPDGIPF